MRPAVRRAIAIFLCALACGCGGAATSPSTGYAGQWSGTTSQGTTIAFTISQDERVTDISIGYRFDICTGTKTFSNLALAIAPNVTCLPNPCPADVTSFREITFQSTGATGDPSTGLAGVFGADGTVRGSATFRNYPGCENIVGTATWSATRR